MDELRTMSVSAIATHIRNGQLSPAAVMDFFLDHVNAVNPMINAVVIPRYEEARNEARQAEAYLEKLTSGDRRDLPPLFGVPCTIKDTYAMKGLPHTGGVWKRRNHVADFDATVVARVKKAGAIIMGRTNVPEAAMWCETYNPVFGLTKNPYDPERCAGGSSGGEGAIVASGASPFGMGSDVGGSIRFPSAFNGIPGHKPTSGRVSGYGHWPAGKGPIAPYTTFGPIARRVDDLRMLLSLIEGPDGHDPIAQPCTPVAEMNAEKSGLRAFYFESNGMARVDHDVRRAVNMCAGALQAQGLAVSHWRPSGVERSLEIWQAGMSQNPDPFDRMLNNGDPLPLIKETGRFIMRRGKITFPALATAIAEKPAQLFAARNRKMLALANDLRCRMETRLKDNGVLICPVFSTPAPRHHHIWKDLPGIGYSGLFNILGFPATVIPVYYNQNGLPVSIQVVAARWNDHLTLAVARLLESVFGGWQPPPTDMRPGDKSSSK